MEYSRFFSMYTPNKVMQVCVITALKGKKKNTKEKTISL
jgi:hypothetical protein